MNTKRSTGWRRTASSSTWVPTTLVVTNSAAPSTIDFCTWDSAAALTTASTPETTASTCAASFDVALDAHHVLAEQPEDEPLHRQHEEHQRGQEGETGEVVLDDPEAGAVDRDAQGRHRAEQAEQHAGPLDRLREEAGQDVQ